MFKITFITVVHSHSSVTDGMVVELRVTHLWGSDYETWYGWPDTWENRQGIELDRQREKVLDKHYRKVRRKERKKHGRHPK